MAPTASRRLTLFLLAIALPCLQAETYPVGSSPITSRLFPQSSALMEKDQAFYAVSECNRCGSAGHLSMGFTVTLLDKAHRDFLRDYEAELRPLILNFAHGNWYEEAGNVELFSVTPEGMMIPMARMGSFPGPGIPEPVLPVRSFSLDLSAASSRATVTVFSHPLDADRIAVSIACAETPLSGQP